MSMRVLSGILNTFAERQFAKDESGRVVFLPRGPRRLGYYVGASDESKFRSLVKLYGTAASLINLAGSVASLAFTQALMFEERSAPLASKLKLGLIVYAICSTILYIGPLLLFWNVYRGEVAGLCSSLATVDPASTRLTSASLNTRRTLLLFIIAGMLILALGIIAAIGLRR
jgi:hypothetical protein